MWHRPSSDHPPARVPTDRQPVRVPTTQPATSPHIPLNASTLTIRAQGELVCAPHELVLPPAAKRGHPRDVPVPGGQPEYFLTETRLKCQGIGCLDTALAGARRGRRQRPRNSKRPHVIKKYQPTPPTRGKTNLALRFLSCPLDAAPTLWDGAHPIN
jgi:hypothetical protein